MDTSEGEAVTVYLSAVAAGVITRIVEIKDDTDGRHEKWNLAVIDVFNDAFQEVDEQAIWRHFTLLLHLNNPAIDADMIEEICAGPEKFKSRVLELVLESEPEWWPNSDDLDADGNDGEDSDGEEKESGSNSDDDTASQASNDSAYK